MLLADPLGDSWDKAKMAVTQAGISFVVDTLDEPGSYTFDFVTRVDTTQPLLLKPHQVPVHNIRQLTQNGSDAPTLTKHGFCTASWPYHCDFMGTGWEEQYCKDGLLKLRATSMLPLIPSRSWRMAQDLSRRVDGPRFQSCHKEKRGITELF